jgi:hypothetical protein
MHAWMIITANRTCVKGRPEGGIIVHETPLSLALPLLRLNSLGSSIRDPTYVVVFVLYIL